MINIPADYGSIKVLNFENMSDNTRLGVVIPTFGRPNYVEKCLESLQKSHINNCILCFVDESLAEPQYRQLEGFTIFPNVDSDGLDIGQISPEQPEFEEVIHNTRACVAVNGAGWMKHSLNSNPKWMMNSHFFTYISDDYLKENPDILSKYRARKFEPEKQTPELLRNFNIPGIPIIKIYKFTHGNMYDSIQIGFDILSKYTDTLVILDSDTIHKPNWLDTLYHTHRELLSKYPKRPIILSGFHTKEHPVQNTYPTYRIKSSLGGCNMCMDKSTYDLIVKPVLKDVDWDHAMKKPMDDHQGIFATTNPSVIQHIGKLGLWSNASRYDFSADFRQASSGLFFHKLFGKMKSILRR